MFKSVLDITCSLNSIQCYNNTISLTSLENRKLSDIRPSLLDSEFESDLDTVYTIQMDVLHKEDEQDMKSRNLLYGVVTYTGGTLGQELIHSQGHLHEISNSCNSRTGEIYQIWDGEAIIYMQTPPRDNKITFYAVHAKAGDVVIVHPEWYHATANISTNKAMTFGAMCIRDYGFEYDYIRSHKGMAFYPLADKQRNVTWQKNTLYTEEIEFISKAPEDYKQLGLIQGECLYQQYKDNNSIFSFLTDPLNYKDTWNNFIP